MKPVLLSIFIGFWSVLPVSASISDGCFPIALGNEWDYTFIDTVRFSDAGPIYESDEIHFGTASLRIAKVDLYDSLSGYYNVAGLIERTVTTTECVLVGGDSIVPYDSVFSPARVRVDTITFGDSALLVRFGSVQYGSGQCSAIATEPDTSTVHIEDLTILPLQVNLDGLSEDAYRYSADTGMSRWAATLNDAIIPVILSRNSLEANTDFSIPDISSWTCVPNVGPVCYDEIYPYNYPDFAGGGSRRRHWKLSEYKPATSVIEKGAIASLSNHPSARLLSGKVEISAKSAVDAGVYTLCGRKLASGKTTNGHLELQLPVGFIQPVIVRLLGGGVSTSVCLMSFLR